LFIDRKASFFEAFNKGELISANIDYIFPEGCQPTQFEIRPKKTDDLADIPAEARINVQVFEEETTEKESEETTIVEATTIETTEKYDTTEKSADLEEVSCPDICCEENRPQIIFARNNSNTCCKLASTIVIPIDLSEIENISVFEITEITNETNSVVMLWKLLRLIEKCNQ
jgi:hypothetical protein